MVHADGRWRLAYSHIARFAAAYPCLNRGSDFRSWNAADTLFERLHNICLSMPSTADGEIASSSKPGIPAEHTVSISINSTWLRVMGGVGSTSAIHAKACQAANGIGTSMRSRPASCATTLRNSSYE